MAGYTYAQMTYAAFASALNANTIMLPDVVSTTGISSNAVQVCYYARTVNPPKLCDAITADETGDAVFVDPWTKALMLVEKTGAGTATLTIEARVADGNWYTLQDTSGADIAISLVAGADTHAVNMDVFGWDELRSVMSSTSGAVEVTTTVSGAV